MLKIDACAAAKHKTNIMTLLQGNIKQIKPKSIGNSKKEGKAKQNSYHNLSHNNSVLKDLLLLIDFCSQNELTILQNCDF